MSRFGIIKSDDKVFSNDKIRFDFTKSFITPDETLATPKNHEVSFDAGATWIDVTAKRIIDFIFTSVGTKSVQLRVTTLSGNDVVSKSVEVLNLITQKLFSTDSDLYRYEPEIDNLLPNKWSSWNLIHLEAQRFFIDWLDEKRIFAKDRTKYGVDDLLDRDEVRQFSVFKTLELIYSGNHNVSGDLYQLKRDKYRELANDKLAKSQIALDFNKNGTAEINERTDLFAVGIIRQ